MRLHRHVFAALVLSALVIWMAGCAGSSDPARLYVLTPGPESSVALSSAVTACSPAIGVGPVRLPGLLDRPQIVTRRGADEITQAEFDRWAEPLADTVPRVLAENVAALQKTDRVAIFPWDPAQSIQYQLVVDVMRFDGAVGGDVVLDARWRILAADGKELAVNRSVLTQPTGRTGYQAVVTAMSRALALFGREIATTLGTLPRAGPGGCAQEALLPDGTDRCACRGSGPGP
jgi:uncharacterized lipoprotein YmbA